MPKRRNGSVLHGQNEANITPLADVTTTLIVVFLITMPALMWNGIQVNQAEAGSPSMPWSSRPSCDEDKLLTVVVTPEGITLNDQPVDLVQLEADSPDDWPNAHRQDRRHRSRRWVVLGTVVEVLDIAKASGAENLAMLNEIGG